MSGFEERKHVLSVQSHVVHGYVGNKSAVFPLQLLGFEVDAVNSVQFCCHTGYPKFGGQVLGGEELWSLVAGLDANGLAASYSHLLTGYIGSATFLRTVIRLVGLLRERCGRDLVYVCDPVLGDHGKLYVPEELVAIYRAEVVPLATLLTPNQFECELLTGVSVASEADAVRACDALHGRGVPLVALTSLDYVGDERIAMLLSERVDVADGADGDGRGWRSEQYVLELPRLRGRYTGTGDLTAALLLAWLRSHPLEPALALEKCGATMSAVLRRTLRERSPSIVPCGDGAATREVPPEIALVRSKRAIEAPPTRAPSKGGAVLSATCINLRGAIRAVVLAAPLRADDADALAWLRGAAAVATLGAATDAPPGTCAVPRGPNAAAALADALGRPKPSAVLVLAATRDDALFARDCGYLAVALLPRAADDDDGDDEAADGGRSPADRARGLSWFADDDAADDDGPPRCVAPAWANDRALVPFAVSSLSGLRRFVTASSP